MRSVFRSALTLTAGAAFVLALGACARDSGEPAIASAGSTASPATSQSANVVAEYVQAQRTWVKCLREQGLNVPDPDPQGKVDVSGATGGGNLKTDPTFLAAMQTCAPVQPKIPAELQPSLPPLSPEQLANHRAFSRCMRANGMPDWPDPGPDGEYPPGSARELNAQEQAANERAIQICDPVNEGKPPASPDPNRTSQG